MEALQNVGIFFAQALIILFVIIAIILTIAMIVAKNQDHSEISLEMLHDKIKNYRRSIQANTLNKEQQKTLKKQLKEEEKQNESHQKQRLFVIDFNGDMRANAVDSLREEVTAILSHANPQDEVLIKVESPGGVVHGYGLAASQLQRIRERSIPLTVCVDKVAASGGYLMSCVANQVYCAPFAILGSIGVVAQVPNLHRLLKKYDVDYKEYTAGEFKRTVSLLGEITEKGEEKFKHELEAVHSLFKNFVLRYRPQIQIDQVATGEHWYGEQAIGLGLADAIMTSDDYILKRIDSHQIIQVKHEKKQKFAEKLSGILGKQVQKSLVNAIDELQGRSHL